LNNIEHLDDAAVVNFSTIAKMKSIRIFGCGDLSGLGLSYLVANKQFLVQLKIICCKGISSEGYHCLTTLTNLTNLSVYNIKLDDIGLILICSSCLLVEYLDIQRNDFITTFITVEGLNNIHCLIHLQSLSLSGASDDWLANLSHSTALTQLDLLDNSTVSDEGLIQLSSLVKLTSVNVNGRKRVLRKI
jgi:Leucine-rich repeat (LRR) protein